MNKELQFMNTVCQSCDLIEEYGNQSFKEMYCHKWRIRSFAPKQRVWRDVSLFQADFRIHCTFATEVV